MLETTNMIVKLRNLAACACIFLWVVIVVLWMRSYALRDTLGGPVTVLSWRGQLVVWYVADRPSNWGTLSRPTRSLTISSDGQLMSHGQRVTFPPKPSLVGFTWERLPGELRTTFPHWVPISVAALLAFILKPPPRLRVSLLELLTLLSITSIAVGSVTLLFK